MNNSGISMMATTTMNQMQLQQQQQMTVPQVGLGVPQKHDASIGVNMNVAELNTAMLDGSCVGMGMASMGMVTNNAAMHMGVSGAGGNQMNGVTQMMGGLQNDTSTLVQNQGEKL